MSSGVTRVSLPDGTPVWARISDVEELAGELVGEPPGEARMRSSYADTGLADRATAGLARMESLRGLLTGVAATLADGLHAARPDEVTVTFGIELAGRSGKVVGLLADGQAKGALTVSLTWHGAPPDGLGQAG